MLSAERRRVAALYQYPGGFLNVAWIAGLLRRTPITHTEPWVRMQIQQTNLTNHNIDITLKDTDFIPPQFSEKKPIRAICSLKGAVIGTDEAGRKIRTVIATASGFDTATVLDMPLEIAFDKLPVPGAEVTKFSEEELKFFGNKAENKLEDSSNMVRLAGIIGAKHFRDPNPETGLRPRCEILLRQHEDEDAALPVRFYGHLAKAVYSRINRGQVCEIVGTLKVDVKRTGEPIDPETGIEPVTRRMFIECSQPPGPTTPNEIRARPEWMIKMRMELKEAQMRREEERQKRIEAQKEKIVRGEVDAPIIMAEVPDDDDDL